MRRIIMYATGCLIPLSLWVLTNGSLRTWTPAPRLDAFVWILFCAECLVVPWLVRFSWFRGRASSEDPRALPRILRVGGILLVGLFALTTFSHHAEFVFFRWSIPGLSPRALLQSRLVWFLGLTALGTLYFLRSPKQATIDWTLFGLFLATELGASFVMLQNSGWGTLPVYSDDHPSFLFRVSEFWHSFPYRENYVPLWNAGVVNSVITSSGTAGYALLTAPLWALAAPHEVHVWALLLAQVWIAPWTFVWALRSIGVSRAGLWTGGLFALGANHVFFKWVLHFGTVGAGVAWAFLPSAFLFLYALTVQNRRRRSVWAGLVFAVFFAAQWPQTWLVLAGFAVLALASACLRFRKRTFWTLMACGAVLLVLLAPALFAMIGAKDLVGYTVAPSRQAVPTSFWATSWTNFVRYSADWILETNPAISIFGIMALACLPLRRFRRWAAVAVLWIVFLYSVGPLLAPRMQLDRMVIPAAMLMAVPATILLSLLWRTRASSGAGLRGAVLALLILGGASTVRIYDGEGFAPYRHLPGWMVGFTDWVRENVPENGRLMFAGTTIHAYGRGHIAYLPVWTGREMISCDYYGFPPGLFEPRCPPGAWAKNKQGIHRFETAYGVSHVVTFRPDYLKYYRSHPKWYREVWSTRSPERTDFALFEVLDFRGRFLEGEGTATADFNRIHLSFPSGSVPERAVVAYHWQDRMTVSAPAEIEPFDAGNGTTFIAVHPNGAESVDIRYRARYGWLFQ